MSYNQMMMTMSGTRINHDQIVFLPIPAVSGDDDDDDDDE